MVKKIGIGVLIFLKKEWAKTKELVKEDGGGEEFDWEGINRSTSVGIGIQMAWKQKPKLWKAELPW